MKHVKEHELDYFKGNEVHHDKNLSFGLRQQIKLNYLPGRHLHFLKTLSDDRVSSVLF